MKIISWNIAGGHLFHGKKSNAINYGRKNINYFIRHLKKKSADIIALQEVHVPMRKYARNQTKILKEKLHFNASAVYSRAESHIQKGQLLSLQTLSNLKIKRQWVHTLPNPHLKTRRENGDLWISFDAGFLITEMEYKGRCINFVNGHLLPFHYFKRQIMESRFSPIRRSISYLFEDLSKKPTVIAADFNYSELETMLPKIFKNNLYTEAFTNVETAPGKGQQDHILFSSKHWNLEKYSIAKLEADHYLCFVELFPLFK